MEVWFLGHYHVWTWFLCIKSIKDFDFWFLGKVHNNQIFQRVLQGDLLLDHLILIFLLGSVG